LCDAAGDKVSLAIAMTALASELLFAGRPDLGSQLAFEQMELLGSIGDSTMTVGLAFVAFVNWFNVGEFGEILRWSQTVIDLAEGDPTKGANFGMGSPLAIAVAFRSLARWWLGRPGWRQDLNDALAMGRTSDLNTFSFVIAWTYGLAIQYGVLVADDSAMRAVEEVVHIAEATSDNRELGGALFNLSSVLLYRDDATERRRGAENMRHARDKWLPPRAPSLVPVAEVSIAREDARLGDRDAAIPVIRTAVDNLRKAGRLGWGLWATSVLVETLLDRGAEGDLVEAQEVIDGLANLPDNQNSAMVEITLMRMRALLARACGDKNAYRDLAARYRTMAESLGFEGHIASARAMTEGGD
jgi:hypothetical protein